MNSVLRIGGLIVGLILLTVPPCLSAQDAGPRSILVLDQSELRGPFYYQIFMAFRDVISADTASHKTIYSENLDLNRFSGPVYESNLRSYLREKYQGKSIGVVVAVGIATLELVLRLRDEWLPGIPVIFTMVDETDLAKLKLPPDVTGSVVKVRLKDAITAARAVVPGLDTIALVGDSWDRQILFRSWKDEISAAAAGLKVIEVINQSMEDIRKRVAQLPDRSAIIYSAVYSDGQGTFYPPATALSLIAEKANRPIIVASETFLAPGGIGGYIVIPSKIGARAAISALRILDGKLPDQLDGIGDAIKPVFDWKQMQRWHVNEKALPAGSEIRFREPTFFESYHWQAVAIVSALFLQMALISFLLHERRRRRDAEVESRHRMSELAHVNRQVTAGELSSSIAHELNQPLGAILTNTESAELILNSNEPDLNEVREILSDIKRDDIRASEVIRRMRGFLKRAPFESRDIDLNQTMREVFEFIGIQASSRNVALYLQTSPEALRVKGDPVQLQQVILNLLVNSMDAMAKMPYGRTVIGRTDSNGEASAVISISDSGPGIPRDKLNEIFDPFFTTKEQGMGIGLSIARTIVLAHQGKIWAENQSDGGAVFHMTLPLAG